MLNRIIKFSLNNRLFILLAVVLVTIGGIHSAKNIEVDVFPDLTMPTVAFFHISDLCVVYSFLELSRYLDLLGMCWR